MTMIMTSTKRSMIVAIIALGASRAASAQSEPTASPAFAPLAQPAQSAHEPTEEQRSDRARFSGKRLALEIVAGEATGLLTTYALCNGSTCAGDGWLAFGADFVVAPLAVYGTGRVMGGHGTLLYSYLGASPALIPLTMPGTPGESPADTLSRIQTEATISALLLPLCSAVLYEVSSQVTSARWRMEHHPTMSVRPLYDHRGTAGGVGAVAIAF
jgi:hypothetical protein